MKRKQTHEISEAERNSLASHRKLAFKQNIPLYIMIAIPLLYFALFKYGPMFGLVMAFQDFKLRDGFFGSQWVGLLNFQQIFGTPNMTKIIWNTIWLGIVTVIVEFPFPIMIAILLNEIGNKVFKKWKHPQEPPL